MTSAPLPLSLANLLFRPTLGSRRDPDRVFDRIAARAGQSDGDEEFTDGFRFLLRHWAGADDLTAVGAQWLELLSRSMERALAARAAIPREALVDVPYSWLGTDPTTGVPKLYEAVGAHWTDADAARLPGIVARPRGTRPHRYDLARYGLTRADVESAFADYNALRAEVDRA
ncbi:sulfotransferase [Streptomyces scabiei]|uniref:sulfotransferase n=1 Tax=Streptomyces scabiei TaxID=1930 RepID=UPI000765A635|nr:sulfotransferase [Streptomyces scabiei]